MNTLIEKYPALETQILNISEIARFLWDRGWAERNAGNISVNITGIITGKLCDDPCENFDFNSDTYFPELSGCCFLITCTGSRMRHLAIAPLDNLVIVKISDHGNSYNIIPVGCNENQFLQPTSELITHLAIHQLIAQRGSKEKVILHTHATELIALTQIPEMKSAEMINNLLWGMHPETIIFIPKGLGFVPYTLPGSVEIAKNTICSLQSHNVVVWEKHGVFSISESIDDAFDTIDIACKSAKIYFLCKSAGFYPEGVTVAQLEELKEVAGKFKSA